ncbi:MAG: thioredoxin [Bacteroidetes bacterium]|nr:thioredoxin [Bacteroidota bacterium]
MSEITLTVDNFEKEVLKSDKPVLVDFWAAWCMPCKMIGPIIAEIAEAHADKVKVGKLNVDEHGEIAQKYNIISIPSILVFKDGEVVNQRVGAGSRQMIEGLVADYL